MAGKYLLQLLVQFIKFIKIMLRQLDRQFTDRIKDLEQTVGKLLRARQPYFGDWLDFTEPIEYVTTRTLKFSNTEIDPRTRLQPGDKVRWKHSGDSNYRYGYVSSVSATQWKIQGGSEYAVAATDPIEFSRGLVPQPIGHPVVLDFDPQYTNPGPGGVTFNNDFKTVQFFMIGNVCFEKHDTSFVSITGTAGPVHATPVLEAGFTYERRICSMVDNFNFTVGLAKLGGTTLLEIIPEADFSPDGSFDVVSNGAGWNISIEYTVAEDA